MSDSLDRKRKQYTNLLVQLEEQGKYCNPMFDLIIYTKANVNIILVQKSENDSVSQIFDNALAGIHNVNKLFEDFNPSETGCQSVFLLDTAVSNRGKIIWRLIAVGSCIDRICLSISGK